MSCSADEDRFPTRTWLTILSTLPKKFLNLKIIETAVSPRYSGALLSNGLVGIAYSHTREEWCQPDYVEGEKVGDALPSLLESGCTPSRALGQAIVNAWGQHELSLLAPGHGDAWDEVLTGIRSGNGPAVFLGEIKRLPELISSKGILTYIVDRNPRNEGVLQDYYARHLLPKAHAVFVTGSAFARPDIDIVLDNVKEAEIVVFIGPSASVPPSGLRVVAEEFGLKGHVYEATQLLSDGKRVLAMARNNQGHRTFSKYTRNITVKIK